MISTSSSALSLLQVPVRVDSAGRVRTSVEQRPGMLAEVKRSVISVARFAKRAALEFRLWRLGAAVSTMQTTHKAQSVRLLKAVVVPAQSGAAGLLSLLL